MGHKARALQSAGNGGAAGCDFRARSQSALGYASLMPFSPGGGFPGGRKAIRRVDPCNSVATTVVSLSAATGDVKRMCAPHHRCDNR
jgi:hypothetical protein